MSDYRIICAWCHKTIREGKGEITHGICEPCKRKQLAELAQLKKVKDGK